MNLDDCWQVSRDGQGIILFKLIQKHFQMEFPLLLIIFIEKNLNLVFIQVYKLWLYFLYIIFVFLLDRGYTTCGGRPDSLGYETKDANTYVALGVDYLKFDSFNTNGTPSAIECAIMRDALNNSGRSIFYFLCVIYTND